MSFARSRELVAPKFFCLVMSMRQQFYTNLSVHSDLFLDQIQKLACKKRFQLLHKYSFHENPASASKFLTGNYKLKLKDFTLLSNYLKTVEETQLSDNKFRQGID